MANTILSTETELARRSKRPRGAQGWCAGLGVEAEMDAACQQRNETKRRLRADSQGCHAERLLGLRPQTRNTRAIRRPDWLLQASKVWNGSETAARRTSNTRTTYSFPGNRVVSY